MSINSHAVDIEKQLDFLGDLGALTQKISKEIVFIQAEEDVDKNISNLLISKLEFEEKIQALRRGSDKLKVRRIALPKMIDVQEKWNLMDDLITQIISDYSVDGDKFDKIMNENLALLRLLEEVMDSYYEFADLYKEDAVRIRYLIYTKRQQIYLQKIVKEYFLIAFDIDSNIYKPRLMSSIFTFDKIIDILIYGNARHKLYNAPTNALLSQLKKIKFMWKVFKYKVEREASEENIESVIKMEIDLSNELENATKLLNY